MEKLNQFKELDPLNIFRIQLGDTSKSPANSRKGRSECMTPDKISDVSLPKSNVNISSSKILSKILDRDKFKKRESIFIPTYLEYEDPNNYNKNSFHEKNIHEDEDINENILMKNDMNVTPHNEVIISEIPYFASTPLLQTDDENVFNKTPEFKLNEDEMLSRPLEITRRSPFENNEFNIFNQRNSLFEDVSLSKRENDNFLNLPNLKEKEYHYEDFNSQKNINHINSYKSSVEKSQVSNQIHINDDSQKMNQDLLENQIKGKIFPK